MPSTLAPIARLFSAGDILFESDVQYERFDDARPQPLWLQLVDRPRSRRPDHLRYAHAVQADQVPADRRDPARHSHRCRHSAAGRRLRRARARGPLCAPRHRRRLWWSTATARVWSTRPRPACWPTTPPSSTRPVRPTRPRARPPSRASWPAAPSWCSPTATTSSCPTWGTLNDNYGYVETRGREAARGQPLRGGHAGVPRRRERHPDGGGDQPGRLGAGHGLRQSDHQHAGEPPVPGHRRQPRHGLDRGCLQSRPPTRACRSN